MLCFSVSAVSSQETKEEKLEYCDKIGELAEGIMIYRQLDSLASDVFEKNPFELESMKTFYDKIVISAYDYPVYSSSLKSKLAISKFKMKYYIDCIEEKFPK
jgi:hypothetical protein